MEAVGSGEEGSVSAADLAKGEESAEVNRWTGRPLPSRYYGLIEMRKTLRVWQQRQEFMEALEWNQTLILVGETGSGKTTQVACTEPQGGCNVGITSSCRGDGCQHWRRGVEEIEDACRKINMEVNNLGPVNSALEERLLS